MADQHLEAVAFDRKVGFNMDPAEDGGLPEWMLNPEELDPELAECVMELGLGTWIKHPLVNDFYTPAFNAMHNRQLRQKRVMLAEAEENEDWHTYVFLHERPWRRDALMDIDDHLTDRRYWELLRDIWIDSENLHEWGDDIAELMARPGKRFFMDGGERRRLERLADPVTIYRGHKSDNKYGWSWTLDKSRAEWFARRFAGHRGEGFLSKGRIAKKDVIAFTNGRNESEIVADPENVKIVSTREVAE